MLHAELIIIGLCLWSIALELKLRKKTHEVVYIVSLLTDVADGKKVITRHDNKFTVKHTGEK